MCITIITFTNFELQDIEPIFFGIKTVLTNTQFCKVKIERNFWTTEKVQSLIPDFEFLFKA